MMLPSPVQGMLIKGGVTLITRGYGQTVTLEPYLYAEDPDYPSMQVDMAIRAGNEHSR